VFLIMTAASKKEYLAKSEAQITTSAPASSIGMAFARDPCLGLGTPARRLKFFSLGHEKLNFDSS